MTTDDSLAFARELSVVPAKLLDRVLGAAHFAIAILYSFAPRARPTVLGVTTML